MRLGWRRLRQGFHELFRQNLSPCGIAEAVAIGIFVGCLPIFGFHLPVCIGLAKWRRLSLAVVYGAANISNPLIAPMLIAGEVAVGEWLRFGKILNGSEVQLSLWSLLQKTPDLFISALIGSVVVGLGLGLLSGAIAGGLAHWRLRIRHEVG